MNKWLKSLKLKDAIKILTTFAVDTMIGGEPMVELDLQEAIVKGLPSWLQKILNEDAALMGEFKTLLDKILLKIVPAPK